MSSSITSILPTYQADLFIGRGSESEAIIAQAQALVNQLPLEKRVYLVQGQRGVGKSWLLAHCYNQLQRLFGAQLTLFYFDFSPFLSEIMADELMVKQLLTQFQQRLMPQNGAETVTTLSQQLQANLPKLQPLVIFLDTVYEMEWPLLKLVESYFLEHIVHQPHTLLIMAGRGRAYPWKSLEIRLKSHKYILHPFTATETAQQITQQYPHLASYSSEVHRLTAGDPMGNYVLGYCAGTAPPWDNLAVFNAIIEQKLSPITDTDDREVMRHCLEALSVLESFDNLRLERMLRRYHKNYEDITSDKAQYFLEQLISYSLAQWHSQQNGFVLDPSMRRFCERYLLARCEQVEDTTWQRLQCEAYHLYKEWLQQYPRVKAQWEGEMNHHAALLRELNLNPEAGCEVEPVKEQW